MQRSSRSSEAEREPFPFLGALSDEEITSALTATPALSAGPFDLRPSDDAKRLTRVLAATHVEVIAGWASRMLKGQLGSSVAGRLRQVTSDAGRLARAMDASDMIDSYTRLEAIAERFPLAVSPAASRRLARRLRDWLLDFADLVGGESGERLRALVVFKRGAHPLLEHLRQIPGVGRRTLEKLYAAGLCTTTALSDADPAELADLVGVPRRLAGAIVAKSSAFARLQRDETVTALSEMTAEIRRTLRSAAVADRADDVFRERLCEALDALRAVVDGAAEERTR